MQTGIRQLIRSAEVMALCGSSYAFAGTTVYPGVSCSSSGAVSKPTNGALMNSEQTNGTSKYNCSAPRTSQNTSTPYAVTATVHLLRNSTFSDVECVLRSIDKLGNVVGSAVAIVPHWGDVSTPRTISRSLSLAVVNPSVVRSYSLRCNIPNVEGAEYGVISYEIKD